MPKASKANASEAFELEGTPRGRARRPPPRCGATASPPRGARAGSGGGLDRGPLFVRQGVAPCLLGVGESLHDETRMALELVLPGADPAAHTRSVPG